jgi:hypothetical protein
VAHAPQPVEPELRPEPHLRLVADRAA